MTMTYWSIYIVDRIKIVDLDGRVKSSRKQAGELHFDFACDSIGECLMTRLTCCVLYNVENSIIITYKCRRTFNSIFLVCLQFA